MKKAVVTDSFEQTQKLGFEFGSKLGGGELICLYGNLGSGKTTFTQGLAKGLGIEGKIISPTFIIMREYNISSLSEQSKKNFYHVDLYRIESERDIEGLGLLEIMQDPGNIIVIEWPDKIKHLLPENRKNIYFEYLEDDKRKITYG
jgi:tRNA threonylcarbamoyladenosine biosynthesis protein TsaE